MCACKAIKAQPREHSHVDKWLFCEQGIFVEARSRVLG